MALKIKWNTTTEESYRLLEPGAHQLDIRGNLQNVDAGTGAFVNQPVKVLVKGLPKKVGIGKFEPGKKMDSETELEIIYIKIWQAGKELVELDKLNFIYVVQGKDMMAQIRANLGMD